MSIHPSSDQNTTTEYHNPMSKGLEDMRDLLIRLETIQMHNIPLNANPNESFTKIYNKEVVLHDKELWDFCLLTVVYDLGISNQIRFGILNLIRMLIPIRGDVKPELVIIQWSLIEPLVNTIIQTKKENINSVDARNTHNRLIQIKYFMERYIKEYAKIDQDWIAWKDNNYIVYTENNIRFFRDSISNWDYISIQDLPYLRHKQSLKCYKNVKSRKFKQGDILIDVYKGQKTKLATQICTSDLADPVDQVRPCRCRGCTGCDGKPGHCRCIGRCRCADADV